MPLTGSPMVFIHIHSGHLTLAQKCAYEQYSGTRRMETDAVLYDRFRDAPVCRAFHEELLENLLEAAWHPSRMKHCLDEHELDDITRRCFDAL